MKTRVLSVVLALVLLLATAVPAFAADALAVSSVTVAGKPLKGSTVEGDFTVTIKFNAKMAKYITANKKQITLKNGSDNVPITVDFDGEKSFCFTVTDPESGSYTLTVGKGIKDDSGRTLAKAYTVAFTVKAESILHKILGLLRTYLDKMLKSIGIGGGLGNIGEDIGGDLPDVGGIGDTIGDAVGGITGGGMPDIGGIGDTIGGAVGGLMG